MASFSLLTSVAPILTIEPFITNILSVKIFIILVNTSIASDLMYFAAKLAHSLNAISA